MQTTAASITTPGPMPVATGIAEVHAVLDQIEARPRPGSVTGRDLAEVERAIARMESVKLTMVAAADRAQVGTESGMTGTSAWLAAHTRSGGAKAAADTALATALDSSLPLTREALSEGVVSTAHAAVIAGTTSRLPESLSDSERTRIESSLVAQARHLSPGRLRRVARRALLVAERSAAEAHEDAELRAEEARAEARVRLTMHDNGDGTVTGRFTVPALAGAILRKTIQQIASPRRQAVRAAVSEQTSAGGECHGPQGSADVSGDGVDWAHRYGHAFVELLEHLPTDQLHGKVAATVVVTIDHDRLKNTLGAAQLDTGHDLSASETRRLACSAGILPAVLDGSSLPLDLGRSNRFFSEAQRVALATTYDECAAEGCDRPYAWSELHHEDPWSRGGATDLHLAVPLCRWHHRRVHDPSFSHGVRTDDSGRKSVVLHRRP